MSVPVRLRQVVLVTHDLETVAGAARGAFELDEPFVDPGVAEFGLRNNVFAVGDCFLEVLTPVRDGTSAGRYLDRRGGDAGYMAIFQVDDLAAARRRVADLGVRVVWQADLPDIAGTHLHPADVPGAIVSLDAADPPDSWHWAGPRWRGGAPEGARGGVRSMTVAVADPAAAAARWAAVLGTDTVDGASGAVVRLLEAAQEVRFVAAAGPTDEGIVEVGLDLPHPPPSATVAGGLVLGGVRFSVS